MGAVAHLPPLFLLEVFVLAYPDHANVGDVVGRNLVPQPRWTGTSRGAWSAGTVADLSGVYALGAFTDTTVQLAGVEWQPNTTYRVYLRTVANTSTTVGLAGASGAGHDPATIQWVTLTGSSGAVKDYEFYLQTGTETTNPFGDPFDPAGVWLRVRSGTSNQTRIVSVRVDDTDSVVPGFVDGSTADTSDFDFEWDGAAGASSTTVYALTAFGDAPVDPDPDPDPEEPGEQDELGVQIAAFLDSADDPDLVALAAQHGAVMTALVRAYTRGVGFVDGVPAEPIRAVIVAASARLVANPEQVDAYVSGAGVRGGFTGFNLVEQAVLNGYRRRVA